MQPRWYSKIHVNCKCHTKIQSYFFLVLILMSKIYFYDFFTELHCFPHSKLSGPIPSQITLWLLHRATLFSPQQTIWTDSISDNSMTSSQSYTVFPTANYLDRWLLHRATLFSPQQTIRTNSISDNSDCLYFTENVCLYLLVMKNRCLNWQASNAAIFSVKHTIIIRLLHSMLVTWFMNEMLCTSSPVFIDMNFTEQ
jgi:hypothetical protein